MKHDHILRHIQDEEYSQAMARVVIMGILTAILSIIYYVGRISLNGYLLSAGYFAFGVIWAAMVRRYPGDYPLRRLITIVTDLCVLSLALYLIDSVGAALYPLYLWIIVGNGIRFGPNSLVLSLFIAVGGFGLVLLLSDYWRQNIPIAIGMGVGMLVLPLFYLILIKRMYLLNKRLEQQLNITSYAATHDSLTDLANRAYFFQRVNEEAGVCERDKQCFAILFVDLDGFKDINDAYGHQCGDQTLKIAAQRIKTLIRKSDIICRLGGDEFGLLLHGLYKPDDLRRFSEKLIALLSEPIEFDSHTVQVTASIGISLFPNHGLLPDELVNKADQAMYRAKNRGKNGYTFYLEEVAYS